MSLLIFTPVMRPLFPFWKARKKRCLLRKKRHANWLPAQLLQINRLFYFLKMGICAWRMCSILLNFSCLFDIAVFLLLSKFTMASFCFSPLIIPQIFGLRWLTMWSDGSCSRSCAPHSCCACNFFSLKKKTKIKNIKNENKKKMRKNATNCYNVPMKQKNISWKNFKLSSFFFCLAFRCLRNSKSVHWYSQLTNWGRECNSEWVVEI